jgi:hypothetical protein
VGAHAALEDLLGCLVKLGNMERADPDASLASDAGLGIVENRSVFRLGQGLDGAVGDAVGIQAVHAPLVIKAVVVDLDKGPENPLGRLFVIMKLLDAPVGAGITTGTKRVIKQNGIFFHDSSPHDIFLMLT